MKIKLFLLLALLTYIYIPAHGAVYKNIGNNNILSGSAIENGNDSILSDSAINENQIINIKDLYLSDKYLRFFPVNDKINISELCNIAVVLSDTYRYYHCNIKWDPADNMNTSCPGRIILTGTVIPPDGFEFNIEAKVETAVIIYDNDNPTEYLKEFQYNSQTQVVSLSENVSDFLDDSISLYTEAGDLFTAKIQWQNTVAPNAQGEFKSKGTIILPKGIKAENSEDTIIYHNFYAMNADKIYLKTYSVRGGNIICPWLYNVEDAENVEIQYSFDNKNWLISNEDEFGYVENNYFLIAATALEPDKSYYFRLLYNDEYTDILFIDQNINPIIIDGDHDGGDNYEQELPPLIVESDISRNRHGSSGSGINKQNDNESNLYSDITKRLEMSDLNTTVISGKRLTDLAEVNNKIIFEKKGISAELNKNFIKENNIKDDDTVSVTIEKGKKDDFSINVSVNNKAVEEIPGTVIRFPKTEQTDGVNNKENNTNQLIINEPGSYSPDNKGGAVKLDENSVTDNSNDKSYINISSSVMAFSIIILAVLIYILWRSFNKYAKQK